MIYDCVKCQGLTGNGPLCPRHKRLSNYVTEERVRAALHNLHLRGECVADCEWCL